MKGTYKCVASNEHGEVHSQSARLELRKGWSGMTVLQNSDPTLFNYSFNSCMNKFCLFETQDQGIGTEIQTSLRYDIVPTQATDSVSSLELATEHSSTSHVDTESTDAGEPSKLVAGPMQRMCLFNSEIDSNTLLDCNSQDTVGEELHTSPQEESNISQGHSLIVSGNFMRTCDTVPAQATDSVGSSELVILTLHD